VTHHSNYENLPQEQTLRMSNETKKKESQEFKRFEELTRKLVNVPKKDVETEEKKFQVPNLLASDSGNRRPYNRK
jgi:HSP90 family molecular chaperone